MVILRLGFFGQKGHATRELRQSFLKQVVESAAGVIGTLRRGIGGNLRSSGRGDGGRRRILFHCGAKRIERAVIARVFLGDTLGNRLRALKLRAGIEIHALLAGMQLETATRAGALGVETGLQHGAAVRAARACDGADHARRSRTDLLLVRPTFWRAFLFLCRGVRIHVAPVAILPLQNYLRGDDLW